MKIHPSSLIPPRFRKTRPSAPRSLPGPVPVAIDFRPMNDPDATKLIPAEQLEWLLAQARVPR